MPAANLNNSTILVFTDNQLTDSFVYGFSNQLNKISNVSVLSVNKNINVLNYLNLNKITFIDIQSTPGYKVGDGKWYINTPNGPELTQPNNYYKISEPKIDLIIFDDTKFSSILNNLYPNVNKVLLLEDTKNFNNEIIL